MKHNKKRNTAFLYEALAKEFTKSIVEQDDTKKANIVKILKEHFSKGKILYEELSLYKAINESRGLSRNIAEKILAESIKHYNTLPKNIIFSEQSKVINKINKKVSSNLFSNFVSNYKDLASISQIFNAPLPVKERVLLEEALIENMCKRDAEKQEKMVPIDNLVYKTFIKKFNEKYGTNLLKEQKELLTNYVLSFSDSGLSLKIFLNEELTRVKQAIGGILEMPEVKEDSAMINKTKKLLEKLDSFKQKDFDQKMLSELLKIQQFLDEANKDG